MDSGRQKKSMAGIVSLLPLTLLLVLSSLSFGTQKKVSASESYLLAISVVQYFSYAIALFLLLKQTKNFTVLKNNIPFVLLGCYLLVSIVWSMDKLYGLTHLLHFAGTGLAAFIASIYFTSNKNSVTEYYWVTILSLMVLVSLLAILMLPELRLSRLKGLNGDPTTLASDCMLAIWAGSALVMKNKESHIKVMLFSSVALSFILLIGSRSVTPLITIITIVGLTFLLFSAAKLQRSARRRIALALIFSSLTLFPAIILFFSEFMSFDWVTGLFGKSSSFSGRTEIWEEAFELINTRPVIGWGFDFLSSTPSSTMLWHNHYHNGYLDMTVRGGFIGLALFAVLYALSLVRGGFLNSKEFKKNLPYISFLIGILIYNIAEVTFTTLDSKIWLIVLFSIFTLNESYRLQHLKKRRRKRKRRTNRIQSTPVADQH